MADLRLVEPDAFAKARFGHARSDAVDDTGAVLMPGTARVRLPRRGAAPEGGTP